MIKRFSIFTVVSFLFISCGDDNGSAIRIDAYDLQVIEYFQEIALGFEESDITSITRKWTDPMIVFMGGNQKNAFKQELDKIVSEINQLTTDGFSIEVTNDSLQANFYAR